MRRAVGATAARHRRDTMQQLCNAHGDRRCLGAMQLVLAASATTSNGLAAPARANPGATTSQGGLFAAVAAKNAEMLAVKEGKQIVGSCLPRLTG